MSLIAVSNRFNAVTARELITVVLQSHNVRS